MDVNPVARIAAAEINKAERYFNAEPDTLPSPKVNYYAIEADVSVKQRGGSNVERCTIQLRGMNQNSMCLGGYT